MPISATGTPDGEGNDSYNYLLEHPNSTDRLSQPTVPTSPAPLIPSCPPLPVVTVPQTLPPQDQIPMELLAQKSVLGGRHQQDTEGLRRTVVRCLRESRVRVLIKQADLIEKCCSASPFPGAPSHWGNRCRSVFCPACGRRRARRYARSREARLLGWLRAGNQIARFVISLPHEQSDSFFDVADGVCGAFSHLRRADWFKDTVKDYLYGLHCRFTKSGPHPHIHCYAAVAGTGGTVDGALSGMIHDQVAPWIRKFTAEHFGKARTPGKVPVYLNGAGDVENAVAALACYTVKAVSNNKGDVTFPALSPEQLLDLFQWLRGTKKRRLAGGATAPYRREHGL